MTVKMPASRAVCAAAANTTPSRSPRAGTVSRLRTKDMKVLESKPVDHHPIGITYNPATDEVWVCSYVGSITVFADKAR